MNIYFHVCYIYCTETDRVVDVIGDDYDGMNKLTTWHLVIYLYKWYIIYIIFIYYYIIIIIFLLYYIYLLCYLSFSTI